ncbi:MAG: dihydrofolate reductase family protein [Chloroflexi bacterium]|nr:dihydrofolate reductase family protein [Chloroflexota bacterium]
MRKVILYMFTTLGGFIAGPNDEFDDYEPSAEEHQFANELFGAVDGILFGRKTYEGFVAYWDTLDLTDPAIPAVEREFAPIFRKLTRVVFSKTLEHVPANTILMSENLAEAVAQVKQQPGQDLLLICGPELLSTLVQLGLVDECRLLIKPTVLGQGKALFGAIQGKLRLKLLDTQVFSSGAVMHHYQLAKDH